MCSTMLESWDYYNLLSLCRNDSIHFKITFHCNCPISAREICEKNYSSFFIYHICISAVKLISAWKINEILWFYPQIFFVWIWLRFGGILNRKACSYSELFDCTSCGEFGRVCLCLINNCDISFPSCVSLNSWVVSFIKKKLTNSFSAIDAKFVSKLI